MSEDLRLTVPAAFVTLLEDAVEAGEFPTVDAALADALAAGGRRHEERAEDLAWLKAGIERARLDPRRLLTQAQLDERMDAFYPLAAKAADEAA